MVSLQNPILYAIMLLSPLTRQTVVRGTLYTLCFLMNLVWITIFLVGEVYASVCGCFDAALAMVSFLFDFFDMCPLQSMKVQEQFHWFMHSVNHHSRSSRLNSTVLIIGVELPILYVQYESKDCRTKEVESEVQLK